MSTKDSAEEETTRYYRLPGNNLKERHVIKNTGYWVREQHAQGEIISKTGIRVKDINHPKYLRRTQKAHLNIKKN